jgi:mycothiol synthase
MNDHETILLGPVAPDLCEAALHLAGATEQAANENPQSVHLAAYRERRLVGSIWAGVLPGATGVVCGPGLVDGESAAAGVALVEKASEFLAGQSIRLAQALVPSDRPQQAEQLLAGGFTHLADLLYLIYPIIQNATVSNTTSVQFEAVDHEAMDEFVEIVTRTYKDSQDCPALDGQRSMDDIVASYRGTGVFLPQEWYIVRRDGVGIGCLVLADHPAHDLWELVYMGIVPEARGQQLGGVVVNFGQERAQQAGRRQMMLAVDALNLSGLGMYEKAGFSLCDRRNVYWRHFDPISDV